MAYEVIEPVLACPGFGAGHHAVAVNFWHEQRVLSGHHEIGPDPGQSGAYPSAARVGDGVGLRVIVQARIHLEREKPPDLAPAPLTGKADGVIIGVLAG